MPYQESIENGIYVLEICLISNFPNQKTEDAFPIFDLSEIFRSELKKSHSAMSYTFYYFRTAGVIKAYAGEFILNKPKFENFKKEYPEENKRAQTRFQKWKKENPKAWQK